MQVVYHSISIAREDRQRYQELLEHKAEEKTSGHSSITKKIKPPEQAAAATRTTATSPAIPLHIISQQQHSEYRSTSNKSIIVTIFSFRQRS